MKQPTVQEIHKKVDQYWSKISPNDQAGLKFHLYKFAESLFQETEEETWKRVIDSSNPDESLFEVSKRFHKERKRIENGH